MYDFVDRPVSRLDDGARFLLYAARAWSHAASSGGCPPGAIASAFARYKVLPALPHIHTLFCALRQCEAGVGSYAPLGHAHVLEDEALLLQLCRNANAAPPRARATLAMLLDPDAVGGAFVALLTAMTRLGDVGLGAVRLLPQGASTGG